MTQNIFGAKYIKPEISESIREKLIQIARSPSVENLQDLFDYIQKLGIENGKVG